MLSSPLCFREQYAHDPGPTRDAGRDDETWNERHGCGEILGKDGVIYFISARVLKQNGICSTEQRGGKEYVSCDKEVQEAGVLWSFDYRKENGQGRDPVVMRLQQVGKDSTTYTEFEREVFKKSGPMERSRALVPVHHVKVSYVKSQRQIGGWRDHLTVSQVLERKRDEQRKEDEKHRKEQETERKRQQEKEKEEERKRKEAEAKQQERDRRDRDRSRSRDRNPHRSQEENAQLSRMKVFLRDANLTRYLAVLEEGYDAIDTLDVAENDDLSSDPICMKRGHLCRLRAELNSYYDKDKHAHGTGTRIGAPRASPPRAVAAARRRQGLAPTASLAPQG
eukprot:gene14385-22698_t